MRLIEPEQLKAAVRANYGGVLDAVLICRFIDDYAETVDAEPVKHGRWIEVNYYSHCGMKCSLCGSRISYKEYYNGNHEYCHKCGAKMDEEVQE